jgi:hypothetical protein
MSWLEDKKELEETLGNDVEDSLVVNTIIVLSPIHQNCRCDIIPIQKHCPENREYSNLYVRTKGKNLVNKK